MLHLLEQSSIKSYSRSWALILCLGVLIRRPVDGEHGSHS